MRRYQIRVDEREFTIDVDDSGGSSWRIEVDGQSFDVSIDDQRDLATGAVAPHVAGAATATSAAPAVAPRAAAPAATPAARPAAAPARPAPAVGGAGGALVLGAPMPGVILSVAVAPGTRVQRGQDVAVLEAMKMENIVRSPREGVIAEVCVKAGQQVAHGQPIVRYEGSAS